MNYVEQEKNIALRPLTLEDSQRIVDWRNDTRVRSNYLYNKPFTLEGQQKYYHEMVETGKVAQCIIAALDQGEEAVGCTVLSGIDPVKKEAEIGVFIGVGSATGRNYARNALHAMMRYGFEQLGLEAIHAKVFTTNEASHRAAVAAGLIPVGILHDVADADGVLHDMHSYRTPKTAFEARQ